MEKTSPSFSALAKTGTLCLTGALLCSLVSLSDALAQSGLGTQQLQQSAQPQVPASPRPSLGTSPSPAPEGVADLKLAPGSMVDIQVFEEPDLNGSYRLDRNGQISIPFAGTIQLQSLTLPQAETAITAQLKSTEVLKAAHVVVNINEYSTQDVVILGEVASPGRFPILGQRRLMDVLAMAGGQTIFAGTEIIIHRAQQPPDVTETVHYAKDVNDPIALNVPINPGDSVLVKRVGVVYVLGSVLRPGGYVMQEAGELNVDQALALAFGTMPEAKVEDTVVIRKQPDGSVLVFAVNYKKVNQGRQVPVQLKPQDVVYVPASHWKYTVERGLGILSGVGSAAVYKVP